MGENRHRLGNRNRRKTKPGDTHHQNPDDEKRNGEIAVLPRRAWCAENGKRHQDEDKGIDRRENPVMQFGPELARDFLENGIVGRRRYQIADLPFARTIGHGLNDVRELRKVEGIAVERNERRVAFAGLEPLQVAVLKNQVRAPLVFLNRAAIRENIDSFSRVALVIDKNSNQKPARLPSLNADCQGTELLKLTGPKDIGENVRADFGLPPPQRAHALRREINREKRDQQTHHACRDQKRTKKPVRRQAGRVHDDDFGVGRKPVEGMHHRDQQRDRRNDHRQQRDRQTGNAKKYQNRLTLPGHQINTAQRLGDPDNAC